MDENMVMENTEVTEPEVEVRDLVPADDSEVEACESSSGFSEGMIGGAVATGVILGGIALFKKIKAKRAAKKAAKEAAEAAEAATAETDE